MSETLRHYTGVVFDVDGTLVDTTYLHTLCWWQAFSQFGHGVSMAKLHRAIGLDPDRLVADVLSRPAGSSHTEDIITAHDALFATWWELVRPTPGAEALLHWCWDRQLTTVVASPSRLRDLEAMLDALGRPDTDLALSGDDVGDAGPGPDMLATALERADLPADTTVVIGDSVWDVEAAARAGLPCIALTCGGTCAEDLRAAGAVEILADPAQLLERWRASWPSALHLDHKD